MTQFNQDGWVTAAHCPCAEVHDERARITSARRFRQAVCRHPTMPPNAVVPACNVVEGRDANERLKEHCRSHMLLRDREPANPLLPPQALAPLPSERRTVASTLPGPRGRTGSSHYCRKAARRCYEWSAVLAALCFLDCRTQQLIVP